MVGTFAVFALLPVIDMKEMGIGLAVAVLIDATIIRAVLLPATMKLLGDRNWYLPSWLGGSRGSSTSRLRGRPGGRTGAQRRVRAFLLREDTKPRLAAGGASCLWRAGGGTRTHDPRFTRALLYQLSYSGRRRTWYSR